MKTKSEKLFEEFLEGNALPFEKIKEEVTPRPDYLVSIGNAQLVFELKELAEDHNFGVVKDPAHPYIRSHSRVIGDHIRRRIEHARKQVQYGAKQGLPTVLLIYNSLDPVFQLFGTEPHDFIAAMYGEYTLLVNIETRAASDLFHGKNQMLQEKRNTSFSALGHLCDRGGNTAVTLFENYFAKIRIPYQSLPPCFAVRRADVSTEPLALP
jgi:hypothetical protein